MTQQNAISDTITIDEFSNDFQTPVDDIFGNTQETYQGDSEPFKDLQHELALRSHKCKYSEREYFCCKSPKYLDRRKRSMFWQYIWHYDIRSIVMLEDSENHYLPDGNFLEIDRFLGGFKNFLFLKVSDKWTDEIGKTLRVLKLYNKLGEFRDIIHIQYEAWNETLPNNSKNFQYFIQFCQSKYIQGDLSKNRILVHGSDTLLRVGYFVLINSAVQSLIQLNYERVHRLSFILKGLLVSNKDLIDEATYEDSYRFISALLNDNKDDIEKGVDIFQDLIDDDFLKAIFCDYGELNQMELARVNSRLDTDSSGLLENVRFEENGNIKHEYTLEQSRVENLNPQRENRSICRKRSNMVLNSRSDLNLERRYNGATTIKTERDDESSQKANLNRTSRSNLNLNVHDDRFNLNHNLEHGVDDNDSDSCSLFSSRSSLNFENERYAKRNKIQINIF